MERGDAAMGAFGGALALIAGVPYLGAAVTALLSWLAVRFPEVATLLGSLVEEFTEIEILSESITIAHTLSAWFVRHNLSDVVLIVSICIIVGVIYRDYTKEE